MFDANKILLQLNELTTDLIKMGLCDDQNFPYIVQLSEDRKKVCIGDLNTNIFLKNVPYRDVYYGGIPIYTRLFSSLYIDSANSFLNFLIILQYL